MELFEKRGALPSPQQASVDYIRTNQPGFRFPLIRRVISKTVILKLQNICFLQPVCSFPPDVRHLCLWPELYFHGWVRHQQSRLCFRLLCCCSHATSTGAAACYVRWVGSENRSTLKIFCVCWSVSSPNCFPGSLYCTASQTALRVEINKEESRAGAGSSTVRNACQTIVAESKIEIFLCALMHFFVWM